MSTAFDRALCGLAGTFISHCFDRRSCCRRFLTLPLNCLSCSCCRSKLLMHFLSCCPIWNSSLMNFCYLSYLA